MHEVPLLVKLAPLFAMILGLGLSYYVYMMRPGLGARIAAVAGPINTLFYNKWYFDELYDLLFVRPRRPSAGASGAAAMSPSSIGSARTVSRTARWTPPSA